VVASVFISGELTRLPTWVVRNLFSLRFMGVRELSFSSARGGDDPVSLGS
jgi:hypothetical protein